MPQEPKHIIFASFPVVPQRIQRQISGTAHLKLRKSMPYPINSFTGCTIIQFYRFENKQAVSMYVPVWDLHNWQIWHIWSFLSQHFCDLSQILQLGMFIEKLSWWIVLNSGGCWLHSCQSQALPVSKSYPLWGAGMRCTLRWRETGREIRVSLEDSLLILSLDHLSLPHCHSPNHWKHNLWVFLPQNRNTECEVPILFKHEWETVATITLLKMGCET